MSQHLPEEINSELLKSLEEDLGKFGEDSNKLIQDFTPYKESIIWDYSHSYYNSKGILAWSNKAPKIIPHKIGTNYQNALAFAQLVKTNLEQYPSKDRVDIVEAGAGSGRFSRHLLLAFRELEIIDKVRLVVSDYSSFNLKSIETNNILDDFKKNEEYIFTLLDITNKASFGDLKIRAFFMHYVLDALNLTIVRNNNEFKELNISSFIRKEQELDILKNEFLQSRITHEDKWLTYKPSLELEKKYWNFFSNYYSQTNNKELYYTYAALQAIDNIMEELDEHGFLLNIDILPGNERRYIVVGNSIAHEIDNNLLKAFAESKSNHALVNDDRSISRLLVTKTQEAFGKLTSTFDKVFIQQNTVREYIELEKEIEDVIASETWQSSNLEPKLKRLMELAPHYAFTYELYSKFYELKDDKQKAQEYLEKALEIDFWSDVMSPSS